MQQSELFSLLHCPGGAFFASYLATGVASLSLNAGPLHIKKKKEEENKDSRRNLVLHLLYIGSLSLVMFWCEEVIVKAGYI